MEFAVPLTRGKVALVDASEAERVSAFRWSAVPGRSRGHDTSKWYAVANIGGINVYMHRFVLDLLKGDLSVDHINGDGLDNRRANLRVATRSQQVANTGPLFGRRFRGVFRRPSGRYRAAIRVDGQLRTLGTYDTEEAAARAWDQVALAVWGEYARLNLPVTAGAALNGHNGR